MAVGLNDARWETGVLYNSMILFDVMLLAGPLGISVMLDKKGLNDDSLNRTADIVTMMGLLTYWFIRHNRRSAIRCNVRPCFL